MNIKSINKIVVFDLDETLGYFVEFGMFWEALKEYLKITKSPSLTQNDFNTLLNLFPEFQRPKIMKILNYLKHRKKSSCCDKIMIYTNNQGPSSWVQYIKKYYESKLNYPLFDQIIAAFKVNGKMIEICRTTNNKNYNDLIRCTKIPENTQICFLDDTFYPEMSAPNVYYINVKPYVHYIPFEIMVERFLSNRKMQEKIVKVTEFKEFMNNFMSSFIYSYSIKEQNEIQVDKIISNKILEHLHIFFETNTSFTQKHRKINQGNKTRKQLNKFT